MHRLRNSDRYINLLLLICVEEMYMKYEVVIPMGDMDGVVAMVNLLSEKGVIFRINVAKGGDVPKAVVKPAPTLTRRQRTRKTGRQFPYRHLTGKSLVELTGEALDSGIAGTTPRERAERITAYLRIKYPTLARQPARLLRASIVPVLYNNYAEKDRYKNLIGNTTSQ